MRLFVIGNGFDKAHGLKTSYMDFREYLEEKDWEYLNSLESMYNLSSYSTKEALENYLWKDFEGNLSQFDADEIIENGKSIELGLETGDDIGVEDTLNQYWEEQYGFIEKLNDFVKLWTEQIDIDTEKRANIIDNELDDLFLSFNYTLLLEKVYKVDRMNVVHIHGSIDEESFDISPVIGHGNSDKINEMKKQANEAEEELDERKASICNAVANYYERTFKDVNYYMSIESRFFSRMKDVNEVFVVGHSFGEVDMPYFKKIKDSVRADAIWHIYYYDAGDDVRFKEKILEIGVSDNNIKIEHSGSFFNIYNGGELWILKKLY